MFMDFPLSIVAAPLLAIAVSYFSILWLIQIRTPVLDYPNSRSLHSVPVPRIGGVGLLLGALLACGFFSESLPVSVWLGVGALAGISIIDDIWETPIWFRLLAHGLTSVGFCVSFLLESHGWFWVLFFSLVIIWMSNLYNFMDGSDGLAGGMSVIGFGFYGLAAFLSGNTDVALINISIAAAAIGFLFHNFYPARIFLGDVGAVPLGYLAATMGLMGWVYGLWSLWLPLLVFSPFIVDATVTLLKRLLRGEKFWMAHREHYYQRLVQGGLGHRNTALLGYGLMFAVGICAVWANQYGVIAKFVVTIIWGGIYLGLMLTADLGRKLYSGDI